MAKIQSVDYQAMPGQANEMRGHGKLLNSEMTKAYASIAQMHEVWYGIRYNELVNSFNGMIPSINDMLTLVVKDVPSTLETVANNYSMADTGANVVAVNSEGPNKITDLTISNDVGMKFLTNEVSQIQSSVSNNFNVAKSEMERIEQSYSKIVWQSEAADAFRNRFIELKNNIVTSFENIESQFKKLMDQTQQDIQKAENANTVS